MKDTLENIHEISGEIEGEDGKTNRSHADLANENRAARDTESNSASPLNSVDPEMDTDLRQYFALPGFSVKGHWVFKVRKGFIRNSLW